jgi:glycosyltransferase involved in cell wall biosynthesis
MRLIYHGFNSARFRKLDRYQKEPLVLTVGEVNRSNLARKGLLTFARASRLAPDWPWLVAGPVTDDEAAERMRKEGGSTLRILGWTREEELVRLMSRAQVYAQPSAHEGFGLSLAEAMLCECVPVVARSGAIPEVVGETGVYADNDDPGSLVAAIRRAMRMSGRAARERIATLYPMSKRKRELLDAVGSLVKP